MGNKIYISININIIYINLNLDNLGIPQIFYYFFPKKNENKYMIFSNDFPYIYIVFHIIIYKYFFYIFFINQSNILFINKIILIYIFLFPFYK